MAGRSEANRALLDNLLEAAEILLAEKAADNAPPPEPFLEWLTKTAQTELGLFPDWPYLLKAANAYASGKDVMWLKRRQIIASWITAAYIHWSASRFPYNHWAVVSAGEREAKKQGRRIKYVAQKDGIPVRGVDLIVYPNGTEVNILPSTDAAGIGENLPGGVHFDEFSKHPYGQQNLAAVGPAVSNSGGQTLITSTTHEGMGEAGCFFDAWQGDDDFLSEDPEFYDETDTQIRLFSGRFCRPDQGDAFIDAERLRPGYTDEVMSAYYPHSPAEAFTSRTGLVYPQFHKSIHVMEPEVPWDKCLWRTVAIDPGGRDPTGLLAIGVYPAMPVNEWEQDQVVQRPRPGIKGQWRHHVYKVLRAEGPVSAYDMRDWMKTLGRARIHRVEVGETGGSNLRETLKAMQLWPGIQIPAFKPPMDRKQGVGQVRWMLEQGLISISPDCPDLIEEFGQYWIHEARQTMSPRADNFPTTTPAHHHADLLDTLRYAVMGIFMAMPTRSASVEQVGQSPAKWERAG